MLSACIWPRAMCQGCAQAQTHMHSAHYVHIPVQKPNRPSPFLIRPPKAAALSEYRRRGKILRRHFKSSDRSTNKSMSAHMQESAWGGGGFCVLIPDKVNFSPGGPTAQTTLLPCEAQGKNLWAVSQYRSFHKHLKVMKHTGMADGTDTPVCFIRVCVCVLTDICSFLSKCQKVPEGKGK